MEKILFEEKNILKKKCLLFLQKQQNKLKKKKTYFVEKLKTYPL